MQNITKLIRLLFISALFIPNTFSQGIPIGQWRNLFSYTSAVSVVETDNKVYAGTKSGLFSYDMSTGETTVFSKINGMSDIGISTIGYNSALKTVVVAYEDANIDLIQNDVFYNLPELKNKLLTGEKKIYHIDCRGDLAYLSCSFGILVLDIRKKEIKDTYYVTPTNIKTTPVYDVTFSKDSIYAATEAGIYRAYINNLFLSDFSQWEQLDFNKNKTFSLIGCFKDKLFANVSKDMVTENDTLYMYSADKGWKRVDAAQYWLKKSLNICHNKLIIANNFSVEEFDTSGSRLSHVQPIPSLQISEAIIDNNGTVVIADVNLGIIEGAQFKSPAGPASVVSYKLTANNNTLWVATGGHSQQWSPIYSHEGISKFNGSDWVSYTVRNNEAIDSIRDVLDIALDPTDENHIMISAYGDGVLEMKNGKIIKQYLSNNSALKVGYPNGPVFCSDGAFDQNGNFWVTNPSLSDGVTLAAKTPAGAWYNYSLLNQSEFLYTSELAIDAYGQKWVLMPRNPNSANSVVVFNDNGTLGNTGDDVKTFFTLNVSYQGSDQLANPQCITIDLEGNIWVGTDKGIVVFYAPGVVAGNPNVKPQQILIQQDGYYQYLMETENVTSIAIDGANRKWIGTSKSGVYLFSADGTNQLLSINSLNSPIAMDQINSIAINNKNGEVFIGTDRGLMSYRGTATAAAEDNSGAYAFPNPVPPNYSGKIAITGLVANTSVKITDVTGHMVYEMKAEGGQAIWDGYTFDGHKAESGVYLVFCSDDGKSESGAAQTFVTKILFMK